MEMPEVQKCFGAIPVKYGTYLISLFGMASGLAGLAGVILYGIAEASILSHVVNNVNINSDLKKVVLLSFGMCSLLLTVGGMLMLIGVSTKARGAVESGYITLFVMNILLMCIFIALPASCFFQPQTCLIMEISTPLSVVAYLLVAVYIQFWFYFISVAWNHAQEL